MSKGTTKGASWTAFVLLALGCGGRAENQVSASVGGSDAASGAPSIAVAGAGVAGAPPGVGPIDATGLPTQLPLDCVGPTSPPRLALPCKLGMGPLYALECYDSGGGTALAGPILFSSLETMLNQPVQIPSAFWPRPSYGRITVDGVRYTGVLNGTAVFSQLDPAGRAFVATLTSGRITWTGVNDPTLTFTCTIPDTPFWAVKGDFL